MRDLVVETKPKDNKILFFMIEILPPRINLYVSERIGEMTSHIRPRSVSFK